VYFPVLGVKIGTIFKGFWDKNNNVCSTYQNLMRISEWISYGLKMAIPMLNTKGCICLNHNLIKTILHILSIYSFNLRKFQNLKVLQKDCLRQFDQTEFQNIEN